MLSVNTAGETHQGTFKQLQKKLAKSIENRVGKDNRLVTEIPAITLHRWETTTEPTSYMLAPSICLIGQGSKRVMLGEDVYVYDASRFIVTSIDLPVVAEILQASPDHPYLGMTYALDQSILSDLMVNSHVPIPATNPAGRGMAISNLSIELLNAFQRLLDLINTPEDIPILAPLIEREICYRLLISDQGARLREIVSAGSRDFQIAKAVHWLKNHYDQTIRIDELASLSGMSSSTFHQHFRALTAMSPLQFQKRLRLNEARRLMLTEHKDAAAAAFEVGYESPSHFNREYSRLYGNSPKRDITDLKQMTGLKHSVRSVDY